MRTYLALPQFTKASVLTTIGGVVILFAIAYGIGRITAPKTQEVDMREAAPLVKATDTINKSYNFAVKDDTGKVLSDIKYTIESADLEDQIIIRGQRASAIQGKTFLIINFALTNSTTKYIQMNSRDYLRLVGPHGELTAPDVYNDPIQIQPISTKESRLGFPVDDTVKRFTLSVGEIDGKKTRIPVSL